MWLCTKPCLWSVHYGPDHFCTTHTHKNSHMHDLSHFLGRKWRPHTATKAATLPCCHLKWGMYCSVVCGSVSVLGRLSTDSGQNTQTHETRAKYECYKTILFSMDADHINMFLSSISSVCEFCLTTHPTFSQPVKNPRVPFRRTTWRSPYTVRESSSSPAWWALWWCAGWGTQQRNLISGASRLSTNWASRSLCGAR